MYRAISRKIKVKKKHLYIYYQNKARFTGVYSRDNLPNEIKEGHI